MTSSSDRRLDGSVPSFTEPVCRALVAARLQSRSCAVPVSPFGSEQAVLVAGALAVLLPVVRGQAARLVDITSLFAFALLLFVFLLAVLEPDALRGWMVALGLQDRPRHVFMTGQFLTYLPYVLAVSAVLWRFVVALLGWETQAPAGDWCGSIK